MLMMGLGQLYRVEGTENEGRGKGVSESERQGRRRRTGRRRRGTRQLQGRVIVYVRDGVRKIRVRRGGKHKNTVERDGGVEYEKR